jgi:phosphoglycolate phosphatase
MRRFVGNGALNQIRLSLPQGTGEEMVQRVLDIYRPYYARHCQIKTKPYEGIPQALAEIGKKYPVAIVSNKPDAATKTLCADYFPGVLARGEAADCPRKPAPDMLFQAMKTLGVDKAIYVGDSEVDVITAGNAGMPCISVTWGFRDREELLEAGAKYLCDDAAQLPELAAKIEKEEYHVH